MRIWPATWNWKIILAAVLIGGLVGAVAGTKRRAEFPPATVAGAMEGQSAELRDGWLIALVAPVFGASAALAMIAPAYFAATLFQVRELARKARLDSHQAMQQSFPERRLAGGFMATGPRAARSDPQTEETA